MNPGWKGWSYKIGKASNMIHEVRYPRPLVVLKETLLMQLGCASSRKKMFSFSGVMDITVIDCHKSYRLQKAMIISLVFPSCMGTPRQTTAAFCGRYFAFSGPRLFLLCVDLLLQLDLHVSAELPWRGRMRTVGLPSRLYFQRQELML